MVFFICFFYPFPCLLRLFSPSFAPLLLGGLVLVSWNFPIRSFYTRGICHHPSLFKDESAPFLNQFVPFCLALPIFKSLWYAWNLCIISEIMGNNSYFTPYFPIFGDKLNQSTFLLHLYFKRKLCLASYGMLRVARMLLITCQCIGRHCQRHWAWSGVTGQVTLVVLRLARWRQVAGHRFTCWGHCHSSKGALDGGKGGNAKTNWDGVCIV